VKKREKCESVSKINIGKKVIEKSDVYIYGVVMEEEGKREGDRESKYCVKLCVEG